MLKGATIHFYFLFDESHLWIASDESHLYSLIHVAECFVTNWNQNNNGYGYGYSFVAKLNWKKKNFLKKYLCFLQIIHYLQKKIIKKKIILIFFLFTEKALFTENEKYIYLIWGIFFIQKIYIHSAKKTFFDHKDYIC